ncbi:MULTISPECIES: DUF167 domain-containing protein [Oxalobacteraceae]|jgi:hypothetical protein|uniref:DUF167 domain-containing protein n=1 Tax=Oxalobacteraceae TaxID=75682 RepID=UPI0010A47B79|nr:MULTISPECIES: DUF167 domain-containing protein [Oxalobacteraceae]
MSKDWCCAVAKGVRITVQITPNAKKSEVIGVLDDALKIRLQAQPIEGKANEALIRYLADTLDVPKSAISITHGQTSKRKIIEISNPKVAVDDVRRTLSPVDG